jgi:hypothetical protein
VELAKNRETCIPVGILVENPLPFYKFSKCLWPKNELLKNPPLLLNLPEMVWYVCVLMVCIRGQFSEMPAAVAHWRERAFRQQQDRLVRALKTLPEVRKGKLEIPCLMRRKMSAFILLPEISCSHN